MSSFTPKNVHNNFRNYDKKTTSMERIIKKCKCGNDVEPYLLIMNPKTKKIEEVMQLNTGSFTKVNKSKSKSKSKSRKLSKSKSKPSSQQGGRNHNKTRKKKYKGKGKSKSKNNRKSNRKSNKKSKSKGTRKTRRL